MATDAQTGGLSGPLAGVQGVVHRLVRRERALLLLDVAGRALLLGAVAAVVLVLAAVFRWGRSEVAAALTFLCGAGAWFAVVGPLLRRWRAAGDPLRQARLVEGLQPELRGRLVTAVEAGQRGIEPGQSETMLALVAKRAVEGASTVAPASVHAAGRHALLAAIAAFFALVPLPLTFFAGGPGAVLAFWAAGVEGAEQALANLGARPDAAAQVGDLVLRYTYPAYTGLEPRVIENSTGDVAGPPGTLVEVRAKTAQPIQAAGLIAYEQKLDAEVEQERTMVGRFDIRAEPGEYQMVTWVGETSQTSRAFAITPEADLPPVVQLDAASPRLELAVDEDFSLLWRARDDYGVRKAHLLVDGRKVSTLHDGVERRAEVFGEEWTTPGELGLSEGDEVQLTVGAWDNDTVGGSKQGVSQAVTLVVLGPRGLSARTDQYRDAIIEAMLGVLADHLVEPFPVGESVGELAAWGETVGKRYQPLQELVDDLWDKLPQSSLERTALELATDEGGALVRFAAVTFDRGSIENARVDDIADLRELRDAAIVGLEDAILMLDRAKRNQALSEAVETSENMEDLAKQMEQALSRENPDPLQMLAMLDQLQAMMKQLAEQTAKLDEGGLKEFLNARQDELGGLMEEIRKAIQEGRMDDARKMMERLATQLEQLAEGMRDTMERQQGEGSDAMKQAEQLRDELEALEQEQRDLQEQVQELREESDQATAQQQAKLWEQIQQESEAFLRELGTYQLGLMANERPFNEKQRSEATRLEAERLDSSARREDVRGARFSLRNTQFGVDAMQRGLRTTRLMSADPVEGPGKKELKSLMGHLDTIERLLEQLEQSGSPQTSAQSQQLQQRQQELEQRLESAQQAAEQMMKELSTNPRGMEEQLDQAGKRMDEASQDLGQGKPMQAQGSQGAAADRIKEARESLEQAMDEARQQAQGSGGGQQQEQKGGGKGSERGDGDAHNDRPRVELPGAEEFRTPEEYRKALLEGMEGEVPEEFRAMKKRYFEELVRQ